MTVDPGGAGFEFVENNRNGKAGSNRAWGQHEYIFSEAW
jgi:hypothetical protein